MRTATLFLTSVLCAIAAPTDDFISDAAKHGAFGEKAARFLVENMPPSDKKNLTVKFLTENLDLAIKARAKFPWAKHVPEEIFLNNVLPYAVFDEPRDPWRADFMAKATPLVKDAKTPSEAAQILNRDFFKLIKTHYHTERKRTNQSPKESIEQGKATCTGLSIILVDVCRAVGIPARAVGTPMWWNKSGNHTWVEIWDKGWHFMGADEYDAKGLNHGWFIHNASKAHSDDPMHAIYATSWRRDGCNFPMVWSPQSASVGGFNVTESYTLKSSPISEALGVRYFEGNNRSVRKGSLTTKAGFVLAEFETKAGTADLNETPRISITPGNSYRLRFNIEGRPHETEPFLPSDTILDIRAADLSPVPDFSDENAPLSEKDAARAIAFTYETMLAEQKEKRAAEMKAKSFTMGDKTMRWLEKTFGDAPADGRSLWISMHGGGEAPEQVNTQQWQNQIRLYQPEEGIYIAPRAPTDKWNMWHQEHIDPMFAYLIESMVALRGVNPDKVYLMGYSAGGDGVWQVAPRMADRYAAAAMMAGHPNEAQLFGLRNLPFAIFMGENDSAVNRNKVAVEKSAEIAELHKADPKGYVHLSRIYPGLGHWMNLKDAEGVPWMAKFTRNPWPQKIVWYQDDIIHHRFYWLRVPDGTAEKGKRMEAEIVGRTIRLTSDVPPGTQILLSDKLLSLDEPIEISVNGKQTFTSKPVRNIKTIRTALKERLDPAATPTAVINCP
jgi:pimeloyl-ACP methyl ester carboxylesterase